MARKREQDDKLEDRVAQKLISECMDVICLKQIEIISEHTSTLQNILTILERALPKESKKERSVRCESLGGGPFDFRGHDVPIDAGEVFTVFIGKTDHEVPVYVVSAEPTDPRSEFLLTDYLLYTPDTLVVLANGQEYVLFQDMQLETMEIDVQHAENVTAFVEGVVATIESWANQNQSGN